MSGKSNVFIGIALLLSASILSFPSYYDRFIEQPPKNDSIKIELTSDSLSKDLTNAISSANRYVYIGSIKDNSQLVLDTQTGEVIQVTRGEINPAAGPKIPSIYDPIITYSSKVITDITK